MIYFITEDDLAPYINTTDLGVLDQNLNYWQQISLAVTEEIRSYTGHRYDITTDLRGLNLTAINTGITCAVGARYYNTATKLHYVCILAATNQTLTNATYFTQVDSRNQTVLMRFIDMVLYHLHAHITPQNVPTIRHERYDGNDPRQQGGAIGWLKMLQKGDVTTVLTVLVDDEGNEQGHRITYGNVTRNDYRR